MPRGGRPFILVPGACLGGWVWAQVAGRLRDRGHDAFAVTLTGLGDRVHLASADVDLETHVTDVVYVLDFEDIRDAVLVGHSYAGAVLPGVVDRRAERLAAVVYLDTGPLPDGLSVADVMSPDQVEGQRRDVAERGDGWRWPVPDRETLASGLFGSASGLSDEDFGRIARLGTAQPFATFTSPVRLSGPPPPGVRRVVIFAADGGMTVATARDLVARGDPRAATFGDPDWEMHELATGHWAMLSLPGPLAELLHDIAADQ